MPRYWLTHVSPTGRTAWQLFSNGRRVAHFFHEPEGTITTVAFIGSDLTIEEALPLRKSEPGLGRGQGRQLHKALENRQLVVQTGVLTLFARHQYDYSIAPETARHILEKVSSGFTRATTITLQYLLHWDQPLDDDKFWDEPRSGGAQAAQAFSRLVYAARWVSADRDQIEAWVRERWADSGARADGQELMAEALQKRRLAQMTLGRVGKLATKLATVVS